MQLHDMVIVCIVTYNNLYFTISSFINIPFINE